MTNKLFTKFTNTAFDKYNNFKLENKTLNEFHMHIQQQG